MARTFIRPDTQIESSLVYLSTGTPGSTLQTNAVSIEDDLNALRIQVARTLDATMAGNWYDDVATVDNKKRSIKQLNTGLDTLETKTLLSRVAMAAGIAVPTGQNYVVLSNSGGQDPSGNIAIALTSLGVVTAQSSASAAAFSAGETTQIAGQIASQPRNLLAIRDATTLQVIESGGYDVFGLLQVESTATDGGAFNDTSGGNRAKISFVTINPSTGNLQLAAAADIGGHTINYSYVVRSTLGTIPEQYLLGQGTFVDSIADTNITLTRAVANQAGAPVPVATDVLWRVSNGTNFKVQNSSGSLDLFGITPTTSGNSAYINTDTLAISTTQPPTSVKGISVATGGQAINVGVATGAISTAGPLTVSTTGANALALSSGGPMTFTDTYQGSSTWTSGNIPLSSSAAEWTSYKSYFGEVSLLNGMVQAATKGAHQIRWAQVTTALVLAGTNLTGGGSSPNLDAVLGNYAATRFPQSNVKLYVNGQLLRPGASNTDTSQDWYPGSNPATGDVKLTFPVRGIAGKADVLTLEVSGDAADMT
jgi:hypothetical protein